VEAIGPTRFVDELRDCALLHAKSLEALQLSRVIQAGLYLCVAELIKQACDVRVASGYSFGYSIGLHAAEVCELEDEALIFMASERYVRESWRSWNANRLRSTVIYNPHDHETNARTKELAGDYGSIVVKDDRAPYGLQIVGESIEVEDLRRRCFEDAPEAEAYSTGMIRSDAAHTAPEQYLEKIDLLKQIRYNTSRFAMVGHSADDDAVFGLSEDRSARRLFESIYAPMNMGRVNERLASHDVPIVLIGSERVSQFAFYGLGDRLLGNTFYFWEDFLESSFAGPAYHLAQDRPRWQ
jgi:hypothetical protein